MKVDCITDVTGVVGIDTDVALVDGVEPMNIE